MEGADRLRCQRAGDGVREPPEVAGCQRHPGWAIRALLVSLFLMAISSAPARASFLCNAGVFNVGIASPDASFGDGAGFHASLGGYCSDDKPVALRGLLAFAQVPDQPDEVPGARYLYLDLDAMMPVIPRWHVYGAAGLTGYSRSLDGSAESPDRHGFSSGYNAGLNVAIPMADGPRFVVEFLWHAVAGPGPGDFVTLTIGLGGL